MKVQSFAKLEEYVRPLVTQVLPPKLAVSFYSKGRSFFNHQLKKSIVIPYSPPKSLKVTCWGINFASPIFNAAGMFKDGVGYELVANQGAGAFLAGTSTAIARVGNKKNGVRHPFAPLPMSHSAINWLGLPNPGDRELANTLKKINKHKNCPVGVSISKAPELEEREAENKLLDGIQYHLDANVDFIEINESCPNTESEANELSQVISRLEKIATSFCKNNKTPLIIKLSNDSNGASLESLIKEIIKLGFAGINLGNTSTNYSELEKLIHPGEKKLFSYFHENFGGGVSGAPLREKSLKLLKIAKKIIEEEKPKQEFHIIRTGGISNAKDIKESLNSGASLCQWYTGYFENFATNGHSLYKNLYKELKSTSQ